jgi:hypothetical protein
MKEWKAFMAKYHLEGNLQDAFNVYGYLVSRRWCTCSSSAATTSRAPTS